MAGVLITMNTFACHFTGSIPCDYLVTNLYEYALLELSENVWMAVQRRLTGYSNRDLLLSLLKSCQSIYRFLFPPLFRGPDGEISEDSARELHVGFEMLVGSISWNDLAFSHLFDSFFQQSPDQRISTEIGECARRLVNSGLVTDCAIMHSRYFLFSTFSTDVTQTLSRCIHMKLKYLFPKPVAKQPNQMYWIIGLSRSPTTNISIYAPLIWINSQQFPLVGLRAGKLRFFISLKPGLAPDERLLNEIPRLLQPLRRLLRDFTVDQPKTSKVGPFLLVKNQL
jgi:hypothetical protein